jgi:hypothetical protein
MNKAGNRKQGSENGAIEGQRTVEAAQRSMREDPPIRKGERGAWNKIEELRAEGSRRKS